MAKLTKADEHTRQAHIATLRKHLKPGSTVYASVAHVARSGMHRLIRLYIVRDGSIWDITGLAGQAIGWGHDRDRWGIPVSGCGMDMCFHTVYTLSRILFPQGFGDVGTRLVTPGHTIKRRPETKRSAAAMIRSGWKFYGRNGDGSGWDNDGGYALKYQSL